MELLLKIAVALIAAAIALPAAAEDTTLLIRLQPDGRYTVWHASGQSPLSEDEIGALEASARPEGGRSMLTAAGMARVFETPNGIPGKYHAKAYSTKIGLIAAWTPLPHAA